jgi:hypothetical protein
MKFDFEGFHEDLQCVAPICVVNDLANIQSMYIRKDAHTRATVLDGSVRAGELSKVVTCHLGLDLDGVEDLLVVHSGVHSRNMAR